MKKEKFSKSTSVAHLISVGLLVFSLVACCWIWYANRPSTSLQTISREELKQVLNANDKINFSEVFPFVWDELIVCARPLDITYSENKEWLSLLYNYNEHIPISDTTSFLLFLRENEVVGVEMYPYANLWTFFRNGREVQRMKVKREFANFNITPTKNELYGTGTIYELHLTEDTEI
jgi:hypothetical protein